MARRKDEPVKTDEDEVRGKPVSLAPLSFEEALRGLLQVPPSRVKEAEKEAELAQPKKRATKKR